MREMGSLFKHGAVYAFGQLLSKAITFLFIPIYINQLGISGFGQLSLIDMTSDLIAVFVMLGVYSGYIRYYREYEDRICLKNTAINFALMMAFLDLLIAAVLAILGFGSLIIFIVLRNILAQFNVLLISDYTLNYKATKVVAINLINLILSMGFVITLVVGFKKGILGIYAGYAISNFIVFLYLGLNNIRNYRLQLDFGMLKNMLKYSVGFIPSNLAATILNLSDRYFIKSYGSYAQAGIYSLGYKVGMLIEPLFVSPYKQVFTPFKFKKFKEGGTTDGFKEMFVKYHLVGCFVMLAICIYSKTLIIMLSKATYMEAYRVVPFVVFSYFLYGKGIFYSLGIELKSKTYLDGIIMLASGGLNILLNILFVSRYGMYGAAVATMLSYVFMNILYKLFTLPLYKVAYDHSEVIKLYAITSSLYVIYYLLSLQELGFIIEGFIGILLLFSYLFFCYMLKLINKDRQEIEICRWSHGSSAPVVLMIDDFTAAWVDTNGNGEVELGEDWGYATDHQNSSFQYLSEGILKSYPSVKVTFFTPVGARVGMLESSEIPMVSKRIDQDLEFMTFIKRVNDDSRMEVAYHGTTHGEAANKDHSFLQEWTLFKSVEEAVSKVEEGKSIYKTVFDCYPKGGKYCGYKANEYSDKSIDCCGFAWWCRDWQQGFDTSYFGESNVVNIPSTINGSLLTGLMTAKPDTAKGIIKLALKPILIRYRLREINRLIKRKQVISIQEHIAPSRNDGKTQMPNIFDDKQSLHKMFKYLAGKNVWYCTCSELAQYVYLRDHIRVLKTDQGFQLDLCDCKFFDQPLLSLRIKHIKQGFVEQPDGTKVFIKAGRVEINVMQGEYRVFNSNLKREKYADACQRLLY